MRRHFRIPGFDVELPWRPDGEDATAPLGGVLRVHFPEGERVARDTLRRHPIRPHLPKEARFKLQTPALQGRPTSLRKLFGALSRFACAFWRASPMGFEVGGARCRLGAPCRVFEGRRGPCCHQSRCCKAGGRRERKSQAPQGTRVGHCLFCSVAFFSGGVGLATRFF